MLQTHNKLIGCLNAGSCLQGPIHRVLSQGLLWSTGDLSRMDNHPQSLGGRFLWHGLESSPYQLLTPGGESAYPRRNTAPQPVCQPPSRASRGVLQATGSGAHHFCHKVGWGDRRKDETGTFRASTLTGVSGQLSGGLSLLPFLDGRGGKGWRSGARALSQL